MSQNAGHHHTHIYLQHRNIKGKIICLYLAGLVLDPNFVCQFGYTIRIYDNQSGNILAIQQHSLLHSLASVKLGLAKLARYFFPLFIN